MYKVRHSNSYFVKVKGQISIQANVQMQLNDSYTYIMALLNELGLICIYIIPIKYGL